MKTLKRFDRNVYKFNPDQMVLRMNDLVDVINSQNATIEQHSNVINSQEVLVYGNQPDDTFGICKWLKQGDSYTNKTVVV